MAYELTPPNGGYNPNQYALNPTPNNFGQGIDPTKAYQSLGAFASPENIMAGGNGITPVGWGAQSPGMWGGVKDFFKNNSPLDSFNSKTGQGQAGYGSLALNGANALFGAYMGMKNYGLAKKTFNENKRQFDMNWDAQRTTVNGQLEDRQRARVASNADAYESVASYMDKNKVK